MFVGWVVEMNRKSCVCYVVVVLARISIPGIFFPAVVPVSWYHRMFGGQGYFSGQSPDGHSIDCGFFPMRLWQGG